jgi:arylsulfatase
MLGESSVKFLAGEEARVHDDNYVTTQYVRGRAYLRKGFWKISNLDGPFDESRFELFDLETDPGESNDLSESEPEKHAELLDLWRQERIKLGIILPEDL